MKILVSILITVTSCSCVQKNQVEKKLIGIWSVDIDSCLVADGFWYNIGHNGLSIRSNYTCELPAFIGECLEVSDVIENSEGQWSIIGGDTIFFDVPKNPLHGKYKIYFYREPKDRLFKIRLVNDSITIVCRKGLQNFDRDNLDW